MAEQSAQSWDEFPLASPKADAWAEFPRVEGKALSTLGHLGAAVTDIPSEIGSAFKAGVSKVAEAFNPYSETNKAFVEKQRGKGFFEGMADTVQHGAGVVSGPLGALEAVASPLTGTGRSVIGHALSAGPGGGTYEESKDKADIAMMGLGASRGVTPVPIPTPPMRGPLGVTLSEGQTTRELPAIQREQAALRGTSGAPAQRRAQEFADQQRQEVTQAREDVTRALDPVHGPGTVVTGAGPGQVIAESPQEAGALVSSGVRQSRDIAKGNVDAAYTAARALPGEIHAGVFEGIGNKIKYDLSNGPEPIIIDDKLTPFASHAIQDIENRVARLQVQNRADPYGQPSQENIVGVDLKGVEQMRKRLSAFRKDAYGSGNAADGRAARAVLDAFDTQIDNAVNGGLFTGDPHAIAAWNTARAVYSDYRSTFTAGKNDPVGRIVEKIVGKNANPAAIPNDVADFIYGTSGVNPSGLNVGVANRIKGILGDQSPEWVGVKQGLFQRLVNPGEGMTEWGGGKVAQRLSKFLGADGRELSEAVFSSPERALLWRYAEMMRHLEVPQAGANWSNTATFAARALNKIGSMTGMAVGAVVGGVLGHNFGLPIIGEAAGAAVAKGVSKLGERAQLRQVAVQLPLVTEAMQRYQRAAARAAIANTPPSRKALATALSQLTQALKPLGITPQTAGIGRADEDQQQVPRPPSQ